MTYEEIKEIVTNNPDITAEEFYWTLIQGGKTDIEIFDLFADAIRSGGSDISNDRDTFLKTIELLANSGIKINDIKDTASNTLLDIAAMNKQADVVRILLNSGKFNKEEKLHALNSAIVQGNVQEFKLFLDYVDHASIQEHLNAAPCNENTDIMKVLLDNKRFTEGEKVDALSNASIDGDLPKVRLLLKHMTGIPANGIRSLLEMIKESKSSLEIDSEFKVDFNNSDHCKYLSNYVIIAILRSAINKKQNTLNVEENGAGLSGSNITTLNDGDIRNLCLDIDRVTKQDSTVTSFEDLQKRLKRKGINLQSKCEKNAVLEYAIKDQNLNVIKFLLQNEVTIINAISQEGRYYVSKIEEDKSILCSVVSYTDNSNAEILGTLLRNINAEQSKLNPEDELYILYQQSKDDAFCTAVAESNSVAATVLIQNDQERIAPRASAVSKNGIPIATVHPILTKETNTNQTVTPNSGNGQHHNNEGETPVVTAPTILTKETNTNQTVTPNSGNGQHHNNKNKTPVSTRTDRTATPNNDNKANSFIDAQFSPPNTQETKYKESKENFYTSLTKDVVGVVVTTRILD